MHIAITNQTGSRNRGCEALVESALLGLKEYSGMAISGISLHTGDIPFDEWRFKNRLSYMGTTCLRFDWLHTRNIFLNRLLYRGYALAEKTVIRHKKRWHDFSGARSADLIFCTGGDNFSADYNSFYNHAAYLNLGRPTFLCGQSIGPFPKKEEEYFKRSTKNVCLITARETLTYQYMRDLNLDCPVEQTADVAFLLPVLPREETETYARRFLNVDIKGRKLAGLSASELITKYYKYGRDEGVKQIVAFVDALNAQGYTVLMIPHVMERGVNNDDLIICSDILAKTKDPAANILLSGLFSCIEAKSLIGLCDVLIGARTHATIASMSQGIPTVAIAYSRKAYGIMEDYYGKETSKKLIVPADQVYADRLMDATKAALAIGKTMETAERMKTLAKRNFELIGQIMNARE